MPHSQTVTRPSSAEPPPSRARLLLLLAVQRAQATTCDLHHLEADARDVAHGVAAAAEARDEHFVVLIDEVEAAIPRHERGDLFAVLDQLHTAALADGGIRLLRLDADLLDDDALRVGGAAEGIALVLGAKVGLLVALIRTQLWADKDYKKANLGTKY